MTKEETLEALHQWQAAGHSLRWRDISLQNRNLAVSAKTAFLSWEKALIAAGLRAPPVPAMPRRKLDKNLVLESIRHAVKQWTNVKQGASLELGRALGSESGLGTSLNRGMAWLFSNEAGRKEIEMLKEADNYRIKHADEIEAVRVKQEELNAATEKYDSALQKAEKTIQSILDKGDRARLGEAGFERKQFIENTMKDLGLSRDKDGFVQGDVKKQRAFRGKLDEYDRAVTSEREDRNVEEERQRKMKEDEDRMTEREKEQENKLKQEQSEADQFFQSRDEKKKSLRSPAQILRDDLASLIDFRGSLTDQEYQRGRREIAGKYASELGGAKEISPVAMMAAGSAELHSLVAKANMPDAKEALARETNRLLERIERELAEQRGEVLQ
jgi:hypothetical protein